MPWSWVKPSPVCRHSSNFGGQTNGLSVRPDRSLLRAPWLSIRTGPVHFCRTLAISLSLPLSLFLSLKGELADSYVSCQLVPRALALCRSFQECTQAIAGFVCGLRLGGFY